MVAPHLDAAPVTYEQWLALPETNLPVEVVDGQPIMNPPPTHRHQRVVARLLQILSAAAPAHLEVLPSPLGWVLRREPLLIREPDLVVVELDPDPPAHLIAPPLLVVEVLSPTSRERDLVHKRDEYAAAGLTWYWLVDPAIPQVLVLRNTGGRFETATSAAGDTELVVDEPFGVRLSPAALP